MKAITFLLTIIILQFQGLFSQKLYYNQANGEFPAGYDLNKVNDSNNCRKILFPKANDVLSKTQSFPFPFHFNGHSYANYKVSDNGYITFNTAETISHKPDSGFTNQANIKNAIVPFWYDFELKGLPYPNQNFPVKVYSYTSGVYPDRVHIIQFYGLTKSSDTLGPFITNANVFAFAVILHEGNEGRFDLVYNFFGKNDITGLAGCSNKTGEFTLLKDQPVPYPVAFSSATFNTIVYKFYPGLTPAKKLYVKENLIDIQYKIDEPVVIRSRISNLGSDTVFKFYYNYVVNHVDTVVTLIDLKASGKYLLPKGENTLEISSSKTWETGFAGSVNTIKAMALFMVDSLDKDTLVNSKRSGALRIFGLKPIARNVLMEISTGGWCGYCTHSHVVAEDLKALHDHRFIPVMHHYSDPMETVESNKINTAYEKGYPYGIFDRKYFSGASSGWSNIVNVEKLDSGAIKVNIINKNFDETGRKITFTLNVRVYDFMLGKFRIGAIITENNVRGNASPSQWSQNNYYSKQYGATDSSNPLYFELRYMDGYLHQYVVLDFPHGAWGAENSLPNYLKPNDEFNLDVSYTLPPVTYVDYNEENNTRFCSTKDGQGESEGMYKPLDVHLIGFVAEYNEDIYKRTVLNAVSNKLLFDNTGLPEHPKSMQFSVFPNPANQYISIRNPSMAGKNCKIEILNSIGMKVFEREYENADETITFDGLTLPTGIYFIKVQSGDISGIQKISILK